MRRPGDYQTSKAELFDAVEALHALGFGPHLMALVLGYDESYLQRVMRDMDLRPKGNRAFQEWALIHLPDHVLAKTAPIRARNDEHRRLWINAGNTGLNRIASHSRKSDAPTRGDSCALNSREPAS